MPELDAERREQLADLVCDALRSIAPKRCPGCRHVADALAPLVAGWLAEAEAGALREAAERWREYEFVEVEWLRDRADRTGEPT